MVYRSPEQGFRHHDFECESQTAKEIVQKINNILELRSNTIKKDYVAYKEKKSRKHSLLL